jgi:sigma-E factor negative regulatory protein RseB
MIDATESLDYDGVFIYQRGERMDTMRIVHKNKGGVEMERLISLSGARREVIRDGSKVTCVFADDHEIMVEKSQAREFLALRMSRPIAVLADYYAFTILRQDRIAGRETQVLEITPKGQHRYGYKLWLDRESGLLLKSVIVGPAGGVLEQVQFAEISIGAEIPDKLLETELEGNGFYWYSNELDEADDGQQTGEEADWQAKWLPAGFEMRNHRVQQLSASRMPVSHMVYSDGIAMVSVFVEKVMDASEPLRGYSSLGAVSAFSRVADDYQITVVGEIPLATVQQIARSVSYNGH